MLMSIEIMLNAVNLAIIAFGAFTPELSVHASTIALFVIAVAAGEATVGLAIVIAIYRNRRTPLVDEYASMREAFSPDAVEDLLREMPPFEDKRRSALELRLLEKEGEDSAAVTKASTVGPTTRDPEEARPCC